jgi:deazaflavin-dependent oxidoreductase (nitroreductase family)
MSDASDMKAWNQQVIDEFRANGGQVGGPFEGAPMVILTSTGAKSGEPRLSPLMALLNGDDIVIFASKGGAPTHPDWYYNLLANPEAKVEIGTETIAVKARVAEGDERDELWTRQKTAYPQFQGYEDGTDRVIPVVVLEKV